MSITLISSYGVCFRGWMEEWTNTPVVLLTSQGVGETIKKPPCSISVSLDGIILIGFIAF